MEQEFRRDGTVLAAIEIPTEARTEGWSTVEQDREGYGFSRTEKAHKVFAPSGAEVPLPADTPKSWNYGRLVCPAVGKAPSQR